MAFDLSPVEQRVLGALIEKEMATPDYYPMSLNALVNACNQKNNREPVMALEESDVLNAIDGMRHAALAYEISGPQHRVPKYSHGLGAKLNLGNRELAVLSVLLCRGPQTPGELRGRTQSLHAFEDLDSVQMTLQKLAGREEALVRELPRAPGARENRWTHLLGEVPLATAATEVAAAPRQDRIAELEERVKALEDFVERLKAQLGV
ncbi:YceH family protein [Nostoc sp. NIES-2111]